MGWKDGLRPASLGGVSCHASSRGLKGGRAGVSHEYPKRNSPYDEDMGRKARHWSVELYVIGDDYMAQRDALIAACERPGPKFYQDHWGRSGTVRVDEYDVKETSDEGRIARISVALVEAGGAAAPSAVAATTAVLAGAAQALGLVGLASFAATGIVGQAAASIGGGMQRVGLSPALASAVISGLRYGSAGAATAAIATAVGVTLSRDVPARQAGDVLDAPTIDPLDDELPR